MLRSKSETVTERVRDYVDQELARVTEDLESDDLPPTQAAARSCRSLLEEMATHAVSGQRFPLPHIVGSGGGGLLCEWRGGDRDLLARISGGGEVRLHSIRRDGSGTDTVTNPTPDQLVVAIRSFLSHTPAAGQRVA